MKNLKKVLALVVALTMVLGTVGFAAYTDVAEDAGEYTAVSTLSSLGILTGYEDGSFKPDGDITRAEFAAVVCRALGAKVSGSAVTGFTDVPADHWASAYIAYCAGAGIVNGMGDGTFAPSANVTVEQAVKMLVVALGYEPMATAKGGYPTGYMVVANTNGITEGVGGQTAAATRADVAKLVFNALDVPMMVQDGFGTQISYVVNDGKNDRNYDTILNNLDVAKLDGVVTGTSVIGGEEVGTVEYTISYAYDEVNFPFTADTDNNKNVEIFDIAEGVNADQYFGYASSIYVKEVKKGDYEIIAIMPGEDSEVMTFGVEDLESASANKLVYYTDATQTSEKTLKLTDAACASDAAFYWNNKTDKNIDELNKAIKDGTDVEVTVIENTGDNTYDMVIVKQYAYALVDTVTADKDRFTVKGGAQFNFDFEDDTKSISIVDKNGDAMEIADFEKDDVVAYISSANNNNTRNYTWIEVINLGQNAVTGSVTGMSSDLKSAEIDGTTYDLTKAGNVTLGDEGTFYLTKTGKIFDSVKSASVAGNYAYILAAALDTDGWETAWQVKMLTKENEIVTYTVRDNFTYNGTSYDKAADSSATSAGQYLYEFAKDKDDFKTGYKTRLVTYKLDSKGLLREINTVSAAKINQFGKDDGSVKVEYDADAQYLASDLEDDTVIFNVDCTSANNVFATGISALVNENEYAGYYVVNDDGETDCVIITVGGSKIDVTQPIAVVANVTKTSIDEGSQTAYNVKYYTNNDEELKSIIVVDDPEVSVPEWNTKIADITVGDLMMFTDDGNGTAAAFAVVANVDIEGGIAEVNSAAEAAIKTAEPEITIVTGYIYDTDSATNGTKVRVANSAGEADPYVLIKGTTNTYTIANKSATKARVYVGDYMAVDTMDIADRDTKTANFFIAIKNKSNVVDFVTLSERQTLPKIDEQK